MAVTRTLPQPAYEEFLDALRRADGRSAERLTRSLLAQGYEAEVLVRELLGPAQHEIGEGWRRGDWTVAGEHQATAITESVLGELVRSVDGTWPRPGSQGRVLLAAAESEWHSLPLRMVGEVLRHRGWRVLLLSPSLPASEAADLAAEHRLGTAGVSCTMTSGLVGAWHTIEALLGAGCRVLAGGHAFGSTASRALRLGADAWAPDLASGEAILSRWAREDPPGPREGVVHLDTADEVRRIEEMRHRLVSDAAEVLAAMGRAIAPTVPPTVLREDLDLLVGALLGAVLTEDATLVTEHLHWYRDLLVMRGAPESGDRDLAEAVSRCSPGWAPAFRAQVDDAVRVASL